MLIIINCPPTKIADAGLTACALRRSFDENDEMCFVPQELSALSLPSEPNPDLDYMDVVTAIEKSATSKPGDRPLEPIVVNTIEITED